MKFQAVIFVLTFWIFGDSFSQNQPIAFKVLHSTSDIKVDGVLDEAIWQQLFKAKLGRPFVQYYPYDTSVSQSQTQFAFAYNEKFFFAAFMCENRNPDKPFVAQSLKRDFSIANTDAVVLTLSPFKDGQNGFSFGVTPYNAQREGSVENGGGFGVTTAWDQVWYSATAINKEFWIVEMAIPLNSIRFSPGSKLWGFNVARFDFKNNEVSNYARVPRNFNASSLVFCDSMKFVGPALSKKSRNVVFIPYVSGMGSQGQSGVRSSFENAIVANPKMGLDVKLAVTRSLNLDLTVNPDFAQVDVDVQQVNLTRFSLFFPERRQFFIENSDLFSNFGFRQIRPFFSRRIGLGSNGPVPIIGGFRLSGKLGNNLRLGVMNITTSDVSGETNGIPYRMPKVNYSVFSIQKKVFSASNMALIIVHDRGLGEVVTIFNPSGSHQIADYSSVVGGEFNLLTKTNRWGGKAVIQKSFYPGLDGVKGLAHATWLRYKTLRWMGMWNHEFASKLFSARTGFVPRTDNFDPISGKIIKYDYWRLEPSVSYSGYPKNNILINNWVVTAYNSSYYNTTLKPTESESKLSFDLGFQKSSVISMGLNHSYYNLFLPFDPLNRHKYFFGKYQWATMNTDFTTNNRKRLSGYLSVKYGGYFAGSKTEFIGNFVYRVQPMGRKKLPKILLSANWNHINVNMGDSGVSQINLIGFKAEYSLSTTQYLTGFLQYNTQTEKMNVNIRFQWRYRPMSDFFIVFSQNYDRFQSYLPNRDLYLGPSYRSLAAKLVYWIN